MHVKGRIGKSAEAGLEFCCLTFKKLILVDPLTCEKRKSLDEGFFSWGRIFKGENRVILDSKKSVLHLQKKNEKVIWRHVTHTTAFVRLFIKLALGKVKLTLHLPAGCTFTLRTWGVFCFLKYQLAISLAFAQQSHIITSFFVPLHSRMYSKKEIVAYKVDYSSLCNTEILNDNIAQVYCEESLTKES